jgi:ATP-binding cassette subfamily B protein
MADSPRSRVPLSRILALARPEVPTLALATVALLIGSGMSLAYPQALRILVDAVLEQSDPSGLDGAAAVLLVLFFVQAVFTALRAWLFTQAGERIVARLRTQVFSRILQQDIAFFDATRTGELTSRLASDTSVLQNTVSVNLSMALRYIVGAIGGVALLLWTSPTLTGVALLVVPVVAAGAALLGRRIQKLSAEVQDALARSNEVAEEAIGGVRTVRSFAAEQAEIKRYGDQVESSYQLAAKRAFAIGTFNGVAGFAGYAAVALVVWYGGRLVLADQMSVGDLTAFLLYTLMVAFSLGAMVGLYSDFMRATGASARVFDLLDQTGPIEGTPRATVATPERMRGDVVLDGVAFAYPTRPDAPVLTGLDLHIEPGEVVALVGPSGAGKSTIAALLARMYDPQHGAVRIDGAPISELDPSALRRQIGLVAQEPILFATSIADNIRYGRPTATDDEVRAAAVAANADGFVSAFPEGYQTRVGERGVRLSGGQKQRVAIARALLKDPPILVLDEATSALDAESEHLVQEALERLMQGRTTLIIAHRLSTVRAADRVVVLDGGKVAESGTHDDLIQRRGLYRRLVERQFGEVPAA